MKLVKLLAVAALAVAPVVSINAAAPASAAAVSESEPAVAEPAGLSTEFSKWVCRTYGWACG